MRFTEKVYNICKKIPRGKVTTYKIVGRKLNSKAYRAIGNILNKNPYWPKVPCNRIVKSSGEVGGFASGTKNKIKLLKKEGIKIKNNKILNFEKVLYRFR